MEPTIPASTVYPVSLAADMPDRFERVQVALRVLVCIGLGALQQSFGGLFGVLYLFLPIVAGILISRRGGAGFIAQDASWLTALLEWVVGLYAYVMFVSDRFPLDTRARPARLHVASEGTPSVGGALARLLTSLPHAVLLAVLGLACGVTSVIAGVAIVLSERYPAALWRFQRDVLAWSARVLAYHASLVTPYPPFSLLRANDAGGASGGQPSHASA
jgi:hypothetical protein